MKYFFSFLFILSSVVYLSAQDKAKDDPSKSSIGTGMDLYSDIWMGLPKGIESRTINQGMNFFVAYRNPIGKSPFATSIGISLGAHNLYSNAVLGRDTSGASVLVPIAGTGIDNLGAAVNYKRSKLVIAYLDLPLELTLKTKKGISASLGVKAGILLNAHTKYKGDDPTGSGHSIKEKQGDLPNLETYRLGGMLRLGYKYVSLYGAYTFTKVFKENLGPELYPVSVGISLRPY